MIESETVRRSRLTHAAAIRFARATFEHASDPRRACEARARHAELLASYRATYGTTDDVR